MVTIIDIGASGARFPCGILSSQASAEHFRHRCREVIFSENLNCILASGDTVHFKGPRGYSCVGRITKICRGDSLPPGDEKLYFQLKPGNDASVQIRLLLPLDGYPMIEALQIPHNSESFLELPELVLTNLFSVVSLSAVRGSAFALHEVDCVNQKYGPVDLRQNTYFVRRQILFSLSGVDHNRISPRRYKTFGPHTGTQSPLVTSTERRLRGLMLVSRDVSTILAKKGNVGWRSHSVRSLLDRNKWDYVRESIHESIDLLDTTRTGVPFRVDRPDLGVQTVVIKIRTESMVIRTQLGFDLLKCLLGKMFGIGVLKKKPTGKDANISRMNPSVILPTDSINCLDLALDHGDTELNEVGQSFVKFQYNCTFGCLTTTVKFSTRSVASVSNQLSSFIAHQDWGVFEDIWVGYSLSIDDIEWRVGHIHLPTRKVLLVHPNQDETLTHTIDEILLMINE